MYQALTYYKRHSYLTNPGDHGSLFDCLPEDMGALHEAIGGVLIHRWKMKNHPDILQGRENEVFIRHIRCLLDALLALDNRPLTTIRPIDKRMIINCRHFATLLCSILRHRGIPSRVRNGFATYLEKSHYQDHWICEYWEAREGRWVMEDADLKLHDLSESDFITAARAWQLGREGFTEVAKFGFGPDHDERGVWVVRENLVHDFAALNGFECVSGDCWGLAGKLEADISSEDRDILDSAARLAVSDERFDARCTLYEQNKGLCVPDQIWSVDYVLTGECRPIVWKEAP